MRSVSIKNVTKRYGNVTAVDNISIEIAKGEFFFLLGPSGCGKTTLLRMLAGFIDPDEGEIRFGDQLMTNVPAHRRNTGMVFQNYALWPHMTVYENIAYGLDLRKVPRAEIKTRVARVVELVRLQGLESRRPNELSGGQQQRVALARVLVIEPDLLLLDEPLSNLDAKLRIEMRQELRRIHAETGITSIYVTHDQKEALSLSQRLAVLHQGRVQQIGAPQEIYTRPANRFVAEFIGQANLLQGKVESASAQETLVRTPFGPIRASGRAQGNVICCIRPEALTLGSSPDAPNRLRGQVREVTYLGDQAQVVLSLSGQSAQEEISLLLHHPKSGLVSPGQNVEACFSTEDVILVPA